LLSGLKGWRPEKIFWLGLTSTLLVFLSIAGPANANHPGSSQQASQPRILFLSSYHPSFPSFQPQLDGIRKGLEENGLPSGRYVLDVEFMDSKRFDYAEREADVEESLYKKFIHLKPYDVLIVADDNALRFAISRKDTLFARMQIVFLGVNNIKLAMAQNDDPRIVGVIEKRSADDTLELARRLFPKSGPITVIADDTRTGRLNRLQVERMLEKRPEIGHVDFLSLGKHTYDSLFERLRTLPAETPVYISNPSRDYMGHSLEFNEFLGRLRQVFNGPLFVTQDHGIGQGVLGGKIVSHFEQGRAAASLAARILNGSAPSALRVISESPNVYRFDFGELERLGIPLDKLPPNSIVANRPSSILDEHANWVFGAAAACAIQLSLILFLMKILALRRRAARELREAADLAEAANHAKSAFLSNMSHELRTPLNSIIGFSDLIRNQVMGPIANVKYLEFAGDINSSGLHLLNLVNGILDLSKIEVGKMTLSENKIDIGNLVADCLTIVDPLAKAAGVAIHRDILPDIRLRADETKIKQILINLLSNAVKFTEPGGRITLSSGFDIAGRFQIKVRDTGIGMTEDEIAISMTVFGQVEDHLTKTREGTGLGLPLARKLTELHDGQLVITSKKSEGTVVTVSLPGNRVAPREVRAA